MSAIEVGSEIPPVELPPISRFTLALYTGASGDHNPIHIERLITDLFEEECT